MMRKYAQLGWGYLSTCKFEMQVVNINKDVDIGHIASLPED